MSKNDSPRNYRKANHPLYDADNLITFEMNADTCFFLADMLEDAANYQPENQKLVAVLIYLASLFGEQAIKKKPELANIKDERDFNLVIGVKPDN